MNFTILGASGFIGSHLVRRVGSQGAECWAPARGENWAGRPLGHVIYCIGLTADWRQRQLETVRAHVGVLVEILDKAEFESFLYLSTTRVYAGAKTTREDDPLSVQPVVPDQLYNVSKLMGESACLGCGRPNVRVVRLSNVYGDDFQSDNFLFSVLRDAVDRGHVFLRTAPASEKDYVDVRDVVDLLPQVAVSGRHKIYNVAAGVNTNNGAIMQALQSATGCTWEAAENSPVVSFPPISVDRLREEFGFSPTSHVLQAVPALAAQYRAQLKPGATGAGWQVRM